MKNNYKSLLMVLSIFFALIFLYHDCHAQYKKKETLLYDYRDINLQDSLTIDTPGERIVLDLKGNNAVQNDYLDSVAESYLVVKHKYGLYSWTDEIYSYNYVECFVYYYKQGVRYSMDTLSSTIGIVNSLKPDEQVSEAIALYSLSGIEDIDSIVVKVQNYHDNANTITAKLQALYIEKKNVSPENNAIVKALSPLRSVTTNQLHGTQIIFNWQLESDAAYKFPAYQLQVLRLYNKGSNDTNNLVCEINKNDINWANALTFETSNVPVPGNNYITSDTLTISQGSGYYLWRVRALGNYYGEPLSDSRNFGTWSDIKIDSVLLDNINTISITDTTDISPIDAGIFYYSQFDADKNWVYSRSFVEDGYGTDMFEQISYSDNLLNTRQTQSYMASDSQKVIVESVPDYMGRPALVSLPVPVRADDNIDAMETGTLQYVSRILTDSSDNLYTAQNYDKGRVGGSDKNTFYNPDSIQSNNQYIRYYDGFTKDSRVADAKGFPYVRQQYFSDGTGRVKETSLAGSDHKISNDISTGLVENTGKTVRNYYDAVTEDELLAIFGNETPDHRDVRKYMATDQNGVTNIAYKTKDGRVIATCLDKYVDDRDNGTANLATLPGDENALIKQLNYNIADLDWNGSFWESSKTITILNANTLSFGFVLSADKVFLPSCDTNICTSCDYTLTMSLIYEPTDSVFYTDMQEIKGEVLLDTAVEPIVLQNSVTNMSLPEGRYKLLTRIKMGHQGFIDSLVAAEKVRIRKELFDSDDEGHYAGKLAGLYRQLDYLEKYEEATDKIFIDSLYHYLTDTLSVTYIVDEETSDTTNYIINDIGCGGELNIPKFKCDTCYIDDYEKLLTDKWDELKNYWDSQNRTINITYRDSSYTENVIEYRVGGDSVIVEKTYTVQVIESIDTVEHIVCDYSDLTFSSDKFSSFLYSFGSPYAYIFGDLNTLFNKRIDSMRASGLYTDKELCECWNGVVMQFEALFTLEPKESDSTKYNVVFDKYGAWSPLDMFMDCVGTHYKGILSDLFWEYDDFLQQYDKVIISSANHSCTCDFITESGKVFRWNDNTWKNTDSTDDYYYEKYNIRPREHFYRCLNNLGREFNSDLQDTLDKRKQEYEYDVLTPPDTIPDEQSYVEMLEEMEEQCESICHQDSSYVWERIIELLNEQCISVQGQEFYFDNDCQALLFDTTDYYNPDYLSPKRIDTTTLRCLCRSIKNNCLSLCDVSDAIAEYYTYLDTSSANCSIFQGDPDNLKNVRDVLTKPQFIHNADTLSSTQYITLGCLNEYTLNPGNRGLPLVYRDLNKFLHIEFQDTLKRLWNDLIPDSIKNAPSFPYSNCYTMSMLHNYIDTIHGKLEQKYKLLWQEHIIDTNCLYSSVWQSLSSEMNSIVSMAYFQDSCLQDSSIWNNMFFIIPDSVMALNNAYAVTYKFAYYIATNREDYEGYFYRDVSSSVNDSNIVCCDKYTMEIEKTSENCCECADCNSLRFCVGFIEPDYSPVEDEITIMYPQDCSASHGEVIRSILDQFVESEVALMTNTMAKDYEIQCKDSTNMRFDGGASNEVGYYHYTLFYYDRQGRLIKTIPPKGVDADTTFTLSSVPNHTMATQYYYNSLGQLVKKSMPDWAMPQEMKYDAVGQLTYLLTPNQAAYNATSIDSMKVTYFKYDHLKRLIETGEAILDSVLTSGWNWAAINPNASIDKYIDRYTYRVCTEYSNPIDTTILPREQQGFVQHYLRNRVSYSYRDNDGDMTSDEDRVYTVYDYDIHGNVVAQLQFLPDTNPLYTAVDTNVFNRQLNRYRSGRVDYDFDLLSGKVKKLSFNKNKFNEFYQRYTYDPDLRLREVESSREGEFFETDALYEYYPHGPLKRVEYGQDYLQGEDFTYTINGWLKAINASEPGQDPGGDNAAGENNIFVRDAFGMLLSYYDGDYSNSYELGALNYSYLNSSSYLRKTSECPLYNGNISAWEIRYSNEANSKTSFGENQNHVDAYTYNYDVLGRLLSSKLYYKDALQPLFTSRGTSAYSNYSYDPNGNFKNLGRKNLNVSTSTLSNMDILQYSYAGNTNNKVTNIGEQWQATTESSLDIDKSHNYEYDASGNMVCDYIGVNYDKIRYTWTGDGKISEVRNMHFFSGEWGTTSVVTFLYDAGGNRFEKRYCKDISTTYNVPDDLETLTIYFRDASGNIIATNNIVRDSVSRCIGWGPPYPEELDCAIEYFSFSTEWQIYGNAQQGTFATAYAFPSQRCCLQINLPLNYPLFPFGRYLEDYFTHDILSEDSLSSASYSHLKGYKHYDLKDHLGNIRLKYSDVRTSLNQLDIVGVYNYYPFGQLIENRTWEGSSARFGFQGQERDDEIAGKGNSLHYTARDYSTQTARMDRIDPLSDKFPSQSPYVTSGNSPISMIDREGREMAHGIYWTNISNLDGDPNLSDAEIRISNKGFVMAVGTTVVVGAGVYVGLEAVAAYGTATVVTTVASEVFDESLDAVVAEVRPELAGIPLSPSDMLEYGVKKVSKSLAKEGIEVTEDVTGTVAKKIPNPNGKKGGPLHQGEITETINTLKNNGYSSIKKERYVPTPNGSKRGRFADIYAIDPNGESVFFQVGKQNKSGLPVKREREAIEDLYQVYPEAQYYFIPYNK